MDESIKTEDLVKRENIENVLRYPVDETQVKNQSTGLNIKEEIEDIELPILKQEEFDIKEDIPFCPPGASGEGRRRQVQCATYNKKSSLTLHTQTHTRETPFKCHICDEQFDRKSSLIKHIRTHSRKKVYKCNICFKQFNRKLDLMKHLGSHTGEIPFKCDICNEVFSQKSALIEHTRSFLV